jgi:hypothetical protein
MLDEVSELAVGSEGSGIEFVDSISIAIALVCRALRVASAGGFRHPDAEIPNGNLPIDKLQRCCSALTPCNGAFGEGLPCAFGCPFIKGFQFTCPELDRIILRIWVGPGNPDRVDVDFLA